MKSNQKQGMVGLKILLIEDEAKIAEFVVKGLSAAGYDVTHVDDGERGLAAVREEMHDLVILDVMLPKLNGFDLLHQARSEGVVTPVIILSAKVDLPDRLMGFEMGADDYLPKPFFVEELVARIKAVMQRKMPEQVQQISLNHLTLDVVSHKVQWFDVTAVLSQREFSLLAFLMRSPGHYLFATTNSQARVGNQLRPRNQCGGCVRASHQAKAGARQQRACIAHRICARGGVSLARGGLSMKSRSKYASFGMSYSPRRS